jgi:hypothetical protein
MLVELFSLGELWDQWGIVGNIIVCILFLFISRPEHIFSHSPTSFPERTFMSCWPLTYYIS